MGAIFGSKNLKAVVVRGSGSVKVAYPDRFMKAVNSSLRAIQESNILKGTGKYGTIGVLRIKNECNNMPYKNFQDTYLPKEVLDKIHPDIFIEEYKVRDLSYMACPIHCSKFYRINDGPYAGLGSEGCELNTVADYAVKCGIDYPPAIIKAHALCNQFGIDLDASAGAISWALECYERGILTKKDCDGLRLRWGDPDVIFELLRKIVYREGLGNILAEGCKRASDIIGRDSGFYAIHMKGQDLYEEVRAPLGWGLGTCVATRGGGHTTGASAVDLTMPLIPEIAESGKKVFGINNIDPISYEDKAKLVFYFEREQELVNSLGICMFSGTWLDPTLMGIPQLAEMYSAATGREMTQQKIIETADRILNLEKAFNTLHTNFRREDDFPPERCLKEGIRNGPKAGFSLSEKEWGKMLNEYYRLRGWDLETSFPTRKCLENLDLKDVADDLEKLGRLGKNSF
jgi:aldehyde:ferredoxin oxidoreductase